MAVFAAGVYITPNGKRAQSTSVARATGAARDEEVGRKEIGIWDCLVALEF